MFPFSSERLHAMLLTVIVAATVSLPGNAGAQQAATLRPVASSEISISRDEAMLRLEFQAGPPLTAGIRNGRLHIGGQDVAAAPRGSDLDREWRVLLHEAMEVPSADLGALLAAWDAPTGSAAAQLSAALSAAVTAGQPAAVPPSVGTDAEREALRDSLARMQSRIRELERSVGAAAPAATRAPRSAPQRSVWSPLRHIGRGISGIISILVTYAVLFGMAVLAILFGARQYIEGVADTVREATGRSLAVGLAATVLLVPAFVLGIVALTVSIVGIPALLLWAPGFPVAVALAATLGYIAVAHAAGEALSQRRYSDRRWFQRANSYYFIITGLGLLMAFFLAANVVQMAGPWLGLVRGMLTFFGVAVTAVAVLTGFGAVLISRAGTRPSRSDRFADAEPDFFREEAGV
jgi:hypothetical protein